MAGEDQLEINGTVRLEVSSWAPPERTVVARVREQGQAGFISETWVSPEGWFELIIDVGDDTDMGGIRYEVLMESTLGGQEYSLVPSTILVTVDFELTLIITTYNLF